MAGTAATRKRRAPGIERKLARWGFFFIVPAVVFFSVFSFFPILNAAFISLTNKKALSLAAPRFIGLGNYLSLLRSPGFWNSIRATAVFTVGAFIPLLVVSLVAAVLLTQMRNKGRFFQMAYYTPAVLSSVVAATIWMLMLDPRGIANYILNLVMRTPGTDHRFLASAVMEQFSTIMIYFWKYIGYFIVIFITGLSAIPTALYEASTIDGATRWQSFWKITLPLLRPTIALVSIMSMLQCLKTFSTQYLFVQSNAPQDPVDVVTLAIFTEGIINQRIGRASAMSIILFLVMLLFTWLQFRASRSDETTY